MPRRIQRGGGGVVFHVLNRGARRASLFEDDDDYAAFLRVLSEAQTQSPTRLLCFALMPNHWHLVLWPERDGELSRFMQWLTRTHAQRWQLSRCSVGTGAVYQGRFRAVPVQSDEHLLTVCRYVERNPLRAGLVSRAEHWRWSSAWQGISAEPRPLMSAWPIPRPGNWLEWLNGSEAEAHLRSVRQAIARQTPFGNSEWRTDAAERLGLTSRFQGRGRPRRAESAIAPGSIHSRN